MLFHGYLEDVPDAMNVGHIIRYNISLNDGKRLFHFYGSGQTGSVIHNNLFYNKKSNVLPIQVEGNLVDVQLSNNIFHIPKMIKWTDINVSDRFVFSDNILLKKNIPDNHTVRKTKMSNLHQLFNQTENQWKKDKNIRPKKLMKFWRKSILSD